MGRIIIRKNKVRLRLIDGKLDTNKLSVDWGSTNKLWAEDEKAKNEKKLIYFLNEHTGGYTDKIIWKKYFTTVGNKSYYRFIPSRTFKRSVAVALRQDENIDFYERRFLNGQSI